MRRMAKYLLQGLIFVAPIAITVFVLYNLFMVVYKPVGFIMHGIFKTESPVVVFIITVIVAVPLLMLIGFLSSNLLTRGAMQLLDRQFDRFPLIKLLHSSVKELIGAFVGKKKRFDQPVLVTGIGGGDMKLVGFITRPTMESWGLPGEAAVYVPAAFNFGGNLIVVPKERLRPLNMATSDVMAFVVSGGIAGKQEEANPPVGGSPPAR